jgi:two-component system response regulator NreC
VDAPDERIAVALLDHQALVREGLCELLERESDMKVTAVASRLDEALLLEPEPDVFVAEINLRDARGPYVVARLRSRFPGSGILVLTTVTYADEVEAAFAAGANGYGLKETAASEIVNAIRQVHRGEGYLDSTLGAALTRRANRKDPAAGNTLTPREVEVLRLLALGHTNLEVAERLNVSPRTAEAHRANLMGKLRVCSRAELGRFALEQGYLGRAGSSDTKA